MNVRCMLPIGQKEGGIACNSWRQQTREKRMSGMDDGGEEEQSGRRIEEQISIVGATVLYFTRLHYH